MNASLKDVLQSALVRVIADAPEDWRAHERCAVRVVERVPHSQATSQMIEDMAWLAPDESEVGLLRINDNEMRLDVAAPESLAVEVAGHIQDAVIDEYSAPWPESPNGRVLTARLIGDRAVWHDDRDWQTDIGELHS